MARTNTNAESTMVVNSGTYTPTATIINNVGSITPQSGQWLQVGDTVTVSGSVQIDPTNLGTTSFRLTIPVASSFSATNQLAGFLANGLGSGSFGACNGSVTGEAVFFFQALSINNVVYKYSFTYRII